MAIYNISKLCYQHLYNVFFDHSTSQGKDAGNTEEIPWTTN